MTAPRSAVRDGFEMAHIEDLKTERLSLVAMTPKLLEAEQRGYAELSQALSAEISADWPPEHWEPHVFDFIARQHADDPATQGWNRYVVLRRESSRPVLIGTSGGFRKSNDEVEIGYAIVPSFRRRGYATEATRAFMDWLFQAAGVRVISAQTFPHLFGSLRVMENCEMQPAGVGDEPGTLRYSRERK